MIDDLNSRFGSTGVRFTHGHGELIKANLSTGHSTAEVYLHGGHVTKFQPAGYEPVLWMSDLAVFDGKKAIRGGIPIIFPWFGPHPSDPDKAQHGFARNAPWTVINANSSQHAAAIELSLQSTPDTRANWPYEFTLILSVKLEPDALSVALAIDNTGDEPFEIATALHSYFAVSNISRLSIDGFEGAAYIDQLRDGAREQQSGEITFAEEVDRIYERTGNTGIRDVEGNRVIQIESVGSSSTVVWNPWTAKSQRMGDFPDDGYMKMVCVETANVADDRRTLAPQASHSVSQSIRCVQLGEVTV